MSTRHFLTKRSTEVNWPSGGVQLDFFGLSDSNSSEGCSLSCMKMSFKFDTANKFFRVLFSSVSVARNSSLFRESILGFRKR